MIEDVKDELIILKRGVRVLMQTSVVTLGV